MPVNGFSSKEDDKTLPAKATEQEANLTSEKALAGDDLSGKKPISDGLTENIKEKDDLPAATVTKTHRVQLWSEIRPSLRVIEDMMSIRVKRSNAAKDGQDIGIGKPLPPVVEVISAKGASEDESDEEFYDVERSDPIQDVSSSDSVTVPSPTAATVMAPSESLFPWKEELESLVRGGVPMALRGEVHHTFWL